MFMTENNRCKACLSARILKGAKRESASYDQMTRNTYYKVMYRQVLNNIHQSYLLLSFKK